MTTTQQADDAIINTEDAAVLINSNGEFVDANEQAAELHRRCLDELLTLGMSDVIVNPGLEHGQLLERKLNGDIREGDAEVIRGDGSIARFYTESEPVTLDGERHVRCRFERVEEIDSPVCDANSSMFEDINDRTVHEAAKTIHVPVGGKETPLTAVIADLIEGHQDVERYKKGALNLHATIDERLQQAEQENPDSVECDALCEAKQMAFSLYLRVQRGDKELHGDQDGRYSDYFN